MEQNKVYLETEGDRLVIRQGKKSEGNSCGSWHGRQSSGKLEIGVPAGIPLTLDTASGEVALTGDVGPVPVRIDVASGNVEVKGAMDTLSIDAASGDARLELSRPLKRLEADFASGDLRMTGGAGEVKAEAASGDIVLENLSGSAQVSTASGDIQLSWDRFAPGSRIAAEAASGDVQIMLPAGVTVQGRLETSSGNLKSDLAGKRGSDRKSLELTGKDGHIQVETSSGDVSVQSR